MISPTPDLAGTGRIGSRLAKAAVAAKAEARARDVAPVDLDQALPYSWAKQERSIRPLQ
jgi:hypothetical protein